MKITLLLTGKTTEKYISEGIELYEKRIKRYLPFEIKEIPALKNNSSMSEEVQKKKEGEAILKEISAPDFVLILDEKGKETDSIKFSGMLQQYMNQSVKHVVFVVGGAYGFSDEVYKRANGKISLSKMTFSHQLVRLVFVEQLYRALTIIKGEPYHHS